MLLFRAYIVSNERIGGVIRILINKTNRANFEFIFYQILHYIRSRFVIAYILILCVFFFEGKNFFKNRKSIVHKIN